MKGEWNEAMLWALAETLSARMDALRKQESAASVKQRELALGPGGNVVQISDYCRRDCACRKSAAGKPTASLGRRSRALPSPGT